jgi:hypothetical protein
VLACTISSRSHLAGARVLAESLREHNPGMSVVALTVDAPSDANSSEPFDILRPDDVGIDRAELSRRALLYKPSELAWTFKAPLLRHLVQQSGQPVAYFDSDCIAFDDVSPLYDAARPHGLALTAHSLTPAPATGYWAIETFFQRHGVFNSGAIAVTADGLPFLDWWAERTARYCEVDPERGLTGDQGWLTLVPALFDYTLVRDPGINVMGWSLHDRDIEWRGDKPMLDGQPLRLFHFAGPFDPTRPDDFRPIPEQLEPWPPLAERPGARRLCHEYSQRMLAAGHLECRATASPFETTPGGLSLGPLVRGLYRAELLADGPEPPNPFAAGDDSEFLEWLRSPRPGERLSRYLLGLRAQREDLVAAFPQVPGSDEEAFLRWTGEASARGEIVIPWERAYA